MDAAPRAMTTVSVHDSGTQLCELCGAPTYKAGYTSRPALSEKFPVVHLHYDYNNK